MKIKKVLVANRSEIAIRVLRACAELNISTVAIYTYEDRYSQHRNKADESYQIGDNNDPLKPYLNIEEIVALAKAKNVDAIHPGYGFLSENSEFARRCAENGIIFIGPDPEVMDALGDKITAKKIAVKCNVPIIESNKKDLNSLKIAISEANTIGYPVMLKAASGGGGRGMRVIRSNEDLEHNFDSAKNEALNAFGDDTMFLEKYVENPKHIEVQIVADRHGNIRHLFERDCSVQRRHQKVVEVAPSFNVSQNVKDALYKYAVDITSEVNYNNIGTVEFLVDQKDNIYFIEVNPRIQVEHTVTEMVTGIDLVKTQIFIAGGYKLSDKQIKIYAQESLATYGFALQCRLTTEDPENNFTPDYGNITTYRSASGMGIRLDAGSIYQGYNVSPFFDSMLVKVSAQGRTLDGAIRKMARALKEFRIRGVKTNIHFDELHALQALVPSGLIVNVSRIDQHRDYLVGALAYSSGFVFNQTLGVMIERIPNPLGKAVGKSTQTLFKQIFPEISSGDLWTHYAYRTIRENSKLAFAQAIQLYSTGEILQRSPTVRKFVYNSMLKNLETHWSKYSSKEKDAYFLSMFVLTEKRFEMVEKDVTILQKWQDETTDTPPSIPDAEALAHIAANTTNSFQTSFNNIDIPSLNLGIDYDAVSNIYLNALETSEKERLEVDAQDLSLDEKLAAYQAIYAKVEAQLQTIEADINGVASFIGLFDPQASKALTTSFESVSLVTKGVTAVLNGVTVGSVLGGIGSIGAGLQLAQSILGSQRPNNDAIILSALKAISNQIQNLQLYVEANFHRTRASFSDVQSKLNLIHSTMLAEFFSVKKDINDVKRAVKKINDKIVRQTDLYKQLAREDLDLSFKNASADLTQKIIYQNQELRSAELSSLIDRFYDVVFSYSRTAWAGADNAFYGKHNSILETDYIASEILSSNYTENPLDYYIASGSGLYGTLNLSSFSPPNPSQWAEANRLISFLILLAKSEEFADIQDTDSPLNAALIASLERSTGYGLSVMDFSFSLQRDPVFFDDLFKLYRDAFSNLVKNAAIELQHSYTTSYQQGGLINTNALEKIYQPMLLNQRSKYLDEAAPAEAIERIKRQVAAVMPGDFSNGYSYSVSSGQHDVDGLPKLRDEENLPVILWPSYDLNEIIATDSQQVVPSYALALARADLAEYYQKYRLSQTGNQLIITHSAILVDKLSGRKFNLVEIDVNYSCPGASIKDYASPGLLLDASDDAIVARYHHPIVNSVCKVYKRVTDIRRIDDDLVSDVFAPILQDSLKRNALHVLSDSTSVENFNKIARLVHYLLLWAFPESARTGKDIILPVVDSSAHPLPEYNRVAQDAVADLFSHIGLSRFNFAPRTSEESLSPFLYEIENALNNRKLDLTGFDGYRQTVIDKIAFNKEATRKIILESEYVGHVYRFFHQLIKFGLEVDPRIEPIIYFNWSYLDYENKYGEQGEVACEGGVKVGEVKFDEIDNGKVERQCLQNGSFSVSAIHCVTPFVSNGSLDNPTCVSVLCENGREYQETWSKAINGGKHWYQCGAWGETQDLGIKCDNLKYDLDLATNRCVEKSCNARPHGAVWRELIDHGEINYQCKFGVESSTGSCHTGFIWSLTNRNCDTRVSCGLGQHYGDSFTYSEVDQCIEKTYRKTCNASGAFDIRFVSQRTVCQIGGPTPLPGTGNPEF